MALAVQRQLEAAQRFLSGLTTLPTYAEARARQLEKLRKVLTSTPDLSTKQSGDLLLSLDTALWDEKSLEDLRSWIAEKTGLEDLESGGRRQSQDYMNLPSFLPDWLWKNLLDPNEAPEVSLEKLCGYAANLGLRLPTEGTLAMLCTLAYQKDVLAMSGHAKHRLLEQKKPLIRKWLQGNRPPVHVGTLPDSWTDIPGELRRKAIPSGVDPLPPPPSHVDFWRVASTWPVRVSNRMALDGAAQASTPSGVDSGALGRMAEVVQSSVQLVQEAQAMARTALTSVGKGPSGEQVMLALEDGSVDDVPARRAAPEVETPAERPGESVRVGAGKISVQQQLRDLQTGLTGADCTDAILKRPAASVDLRKRPATQMARPAAASKGSLPRQPSRKQRPASDDTRKKFTSRAYHAAKKRVLRSGGSTVAATEAAREALRKASVRWAADHA